MFFIYPPSVGAQDTNAFDLAYQDYSLKTEVYNSAHDDYQLARSLYLRHGTLTSQNKARESTLALLQARDEVLIAYFEVLKARLNSVSSIDPSSQALLISRLDEEISWFASHKANLSTAGSLEDLVADSDEARDRYNTLGPLLYETISQVPYGRVDRIQDRINENFLAIREKVNTIRSESREDYQLSSKKLEIIDSWLLQTEGKIQRSEEKLQETELLLASYQTIKKNNFTQSANTYSSVLAQLENALKDLKDASLAIKEIIREMKTT